MSMHAAVTFLRVLRRRKRITQEALARAVGVSKRTIERLENYKDEDTVDVGAGVLLKVIAELHAPAEHVVQLAANPLATPEDGEHLAATWLDEEDLEKGEQGKRAASEARAWYHMTPGARAYVQTLREALGLPLSIFEHLTGITEEQWHDWEQGRLADVPSRALFVVIADLDASLSHIQQLIEANASEEQGRLFARRRLLERQQGQQTLVVDDMDKSVVKHLRALSFEQKQSVLNYIRWLEDERGETVRNLSYATSNENDRSQFQVVLSLAKQLMEAMNKLSWLRRDRWLWFLAANHSQLDYMFPATESASATTRTTLDNHQNEHL